MDESLIEEELTKKIISAAIAVQTYMQLTECRVGLLMHFNMPVLKDGIKGSSCKSKSITPRFVPRSPKGHPLSSPLRGKALRGKTLRSGPSSHSSSQK
jgi:hypothetical protein